MGTIILPILKAKVQKVELLAQGHRARHDGMESDLGLSDCGVHTLYSAATLDLETSAECP